MLSGQPYAQADMDRRKLRIIVLVVAGIIVLVVGVRAATVYSGPLSWEAWWDVHAEVCFGKSGESLSWEETRYIGERYYNGREAEAAVLARRLDLEKRNAEFSDWLLRWVVRPIGLFAILTAALVVSRLLSDRIRRPPVPS